MTIDPSPGEPQETFGPYIVHERVGVGGMATVHRAKERGIEGFERVVALKRLLPHLAEDATFVKAFVREAKLASMLQHANIVQLFELGRVGSAYFISMEYIDGRDIRQLLRQARRAAGPPTVNVTVSLLIQLCDALEYAHTRIDDRGEPLGLVHRDVSPSNLLVTRSGHLKVIDFGIAKAQSSQLRTQTGRVKGKLAYMAPEAISGKDLDARSDLFSCGVIAHELLTARPLFASKNEYQTILNVQKAELLPPSAFNQAVPPELDHVVLRALARDRDQRYESAAQMRDDLHAVRIQYQLSATNREVQSWIEWAFALDGNAGNFGTMTDSFGTVGSRSPVLSAATPRPPTASGRSTVATLAAAAADSGRARTTTVVEPEEEEAADVAWGGGKDQGSGAPVVLDDVPDHTHRRPTFSAAELAAADEEAPTPLPPPPALAAAPSFGESGPVAWAHGSSADAVPVGVRGTGRMGATRPSGARATAVEPVPGTATTSAMAPVEDAAADGFGASIVTRRKSVAPWVLGGIAVAAAAVAGYVALTGRPDQAARKPPVVVAAPPATLKFIVEPADATIKIAGLEPHVGAPWSIQLDPGVAQVKISREAHLSWETSIELSSNETQTVRVVLGPVPAGADSNLASLELSSEPTGLAALLDGHDLGRRTPLAMTLSPGLHTVTLRQYGETVWRHTFDAEAGTLYQFNPSMTGNKLAERQARERDASPEPTRATAAPAVRNAAPSPVELLTRSGSAAPPSTNPGAGIGSALPVTAATIGDPGASAAIVAAAAPTVGAGSAAALTKPRTAEAIAGPGTTTAPLAPQPTTAIQAAAAVKPTAVPAPGAASGAVVAKPASATIPIVPPNAIKRISGAMPQIYTINRTGEELPKSASAKICVDRAGAVTSVTILRITGDVATKLADAMRSWRYTPYLLDGRPSGACFVNSFTLK